MDFYSNLPTSGESSSSIYPTLFEIISAQEIDDLLTPAVRYIIANLVGRYPNRYTLQVNNRFDEWFMLGVKYIIEKHHLDNWNGTFIEKFYGLKRLNSSNSLLLKVLKQQLPIDLPQRLTKQQINVVLAEKVLFPYLITKLDLYHSKLLASTLFQNQSEQQDDDEHTALQKKAHRLIRYLKDIFTKYYPWAKKFAFALNFITKLFFLSGKLGSTTFLDFLFKIEYTRLTPQDYKINEPRPRLQNPLLRNRPPRVNTPMLLNRLQSFGRIIAKVAKYSGSQLFPAFIFVLRVFQWWTTQDLMGKIQRKLNDIDKDIPPPPINSKKQTSTKCEICHQIITNPCAIETGYVFCYPCVLNYLPANEGRCPVTGKRLLGCQYDKESGKWNITSVRKLLI